MQRDDALSSDEATAMADGSDEPARRTLYVEGLPLSANPLLTTHLRSLLAATVSAQLLDVYLARPLPARLGVVSQQSSSASTDINSGNCKSSDEQKASTGFKAQSSRQRTANASELSFRGYCFIVLASVRQAEEALIWLHANREISTSNIGTQEDLGSLIRDGKLKSLKCMSLCQYQAREQEYLHELEVHNARFQEDLTALKAHKATIVVTNKSTKWAMRQHVNSQEEDVNIVCENSSDALSTLLPSDYITGTVIQFSNVAPEAGNSKLISFFARPTIPLYITHAKKSPVGYARYATAGAAQSCVDYFETHTVVHAFKNDTCGTEYQNEVDMRAYAAIRVKTRLLGPHSQEERLFWVNIARERMSRQGTKQVDNTIAMPALDEPLEPITQQPATATDSPENTIATKRSHKRKLSEQISSDSHRVRQRTQLKHIHFTSDQE